jgi:hypothetical protein
VFEDNFDPLNDNTMDSQPHESDSEEDVGLFVVACCFFLADSMVLLPTCVLVGHAVCHATSFKNEFYGHYKRSKRGNSPAG